MNSNHEKDASLFEPKIGFNSPLLESGDRNVAKPTKAILGLGLLFAIALALYGFNVARHSSAQSSVQTPIVSSSGFDTAHLAPREDHSFQ
jgi:hypothetical protein